MITTEMMNQVFDEIFVQETGASYTEVETARKKANLAKKEYFDKLAEIKKIKLEEPTMKQLISIDMTLTFPIYLVKNRYEDIDSVYLPKLKVTLDGRFRQYSSLTEYYCSKIIEDDCCEFTIKEGVNLREIKEYYDKYYYPCALKHAKDVFYKRQESKIRDSSIGLKEKWRKAQDEFNSLLKSRYHVSSSFSPITDKRYSKNIYLDSIPLEHVLKLAFAQGRGLHGIKL